MELEARVRRLEVQNFRLRILLWFLTLAAAGVAVVAVLRFAEHRRVARQPKGPTFVHAERFILLDAMGNQRAVLGIGTNDETMFELRDVAGTPRLRMDVPKSGPGITLTDSRGNVRTLMTVHSDQPYLGMTDEQGNDLFQAPKP